MLEPGLSERARFLRDELKAILRFSTDGWLTTQIVVTAHELDSVREGATLGEVVALCTRAETLINLWRSHR